MRTLFVLLLFMGVALAHPPEHRFYKWFREQHSLKGVWCCNESDGYSLPETEWRMRNGEFEALIEGQWHTIPAEKLVRDPGNPTGHAAIWYMKLRNGAINIYCFAPGMLG